MKYTNTLPTVNADKKINIIQRIAWFLINFINNNIFPNKSDIPTKQFIPNLSNDSWNEIDKTASPTRVLSDLFWLQINWHEVEQELNEINILDTGCGDGGYFLKLNKFTDNTIHKYCGIDIEEKSTWNNLKKDYPNIDFKKINSNDLLEFIPSDSNLFISQSAIEHFEEDLVYFQHIKDFIDKTKNDVIQIHLFPAAACLTQYIWHGVRQYTPRSVSKITKIFEDDNTYSVLYKMGGNLCNKVHRDFITIPVYSKGVDYRDLKKNEYITHLKNSLENDKGDKNPSFYALVIHSNYKNKIFYDMESLV